MRKNRMWILAFLLMPLSMAIVFNGCKDDEEPSCPTVDYTAIDMTLKHPDSSSAVVIDTTLGLKPILSELFFPDAPTEGARIYSSTESIGGTGVYFVNEEGTRDEMVSRSRAILYGIIF